MVKNEIHEFVDRIIEKYEKDKIIDGSIDLDIKDKSLLDEFFKNDPKGLDTTFKKYGISVLDLDLKRILGIETHVQ